MPRERGASRKRLTIGQKLDLLKKMDEGWSVMRLCEHFGIKKQTVSDIKKAKPTLQEYAQKYSADASVESTAVGELKSVRRPINEKHEEAVFRWYTQMRSTKVNVPSFAIKEAAGQIATKMGMADFRASDGWLFRFRRRHALVDKKSHGEAGSAPVEEIEPFRQRLLKIIDEEALVMGQVYNFDETGLFWKSGPRNTQVVKGAGVVRGQKQSKLRVSAMCFANADGSHRLKPCIVGSAMRPRAIKDVMHSLPVHYYSSRKAWFTSDIIKRYLFDHAFLEIRRYQEDVLKIQPDRVRAIVLMDNCPAHPPENELMSDDGRIRCIFLPKNTTSIIQPMDQGIIYAAKRIYRRNFLTEVMVVSEPEDSDEEDTRGQRTLEKVASYNLRNAIYNWAEAWKALKPSTLANAWKKLLGNGGATQQDFGGFEDDDIHRLFVRAGENVQQEAINEWLQEDEGDPGHQLMTMDEIVEEVVNPVEEEEQDPDESLPPKHKLSAVRSACDVILEHMDSVYNPQMFRYYGAVRELRKVVCQQQMSGGKQTKISTFFTPREPQPTVEVRSSSDPDDPSSASPPPSPQPGPSGI